MTKTDKYRFEFDVRCPGCGYVGSVHASESYDTDHPDFSIEGMSGFMVDNPSRYRFNNRLHCRTCFKEFSLGEAE